MADKRVVIPDDLGTSFELKNKKWSIKLDNGLITNSQGAISLDPNTIGEVIAEAISNSPGTGMGLNADGKLSVLRSPDAGNLLEVRENGIYYGVVAQQENWYIDSINGNDNNKGTKDAPLKTLYGLNKKLKNGTYTYNIYLKEGGTYPLMNTETNEYSNLLNSLSYVNKLSFRIYGDIFDNTINTSENISKMGGRFYPYCIKELQRPVIQISEFDYVYESGVHSVRIPRLGNPNIGVVEFRGIKFDVIGNTFDTNYDALYSYMIGCKEAYFEGCVFNFSRRPTKVWYFPFTSDANISIANCGVENPQNNTSYSYSSHYSKICFISVSDILTTPTTGGSNGVPSYDVFLNTVDFLPFLNQEDTYNKLYTGSNKSYITNV